MYPRRDGKGVCAFYQFSEFAIFTLWRVCEYSFTSNNPFGPASARCLNTFEMPKAYFDISGADPLI